MPSNAAKTQRYLVSLSCSSARAERGVSGFRDAPGLLTARLHTSLQIASFTIPACWSPAEQQQQQLIDWIPLFMLAAVVSGLSAACWV